ncbi:MAG: hypothetical protein IPJ65_15770 [Archangiaceae bacterium]|nr:hypothetical protein [Archangiaceae bacterium]
MRLNRSSAWTPTSTAQDDDATKSDDDEKGRYRAVEVSAKEREQLLAHIRGGATVVYVPWGSRDNPLLTALDVHLWRAERELGLRTLEPAQPSPFTAGVERVEAKVHSYLDLPAGSIPLLQDSVLKEYVAGIVPYGQGQLVVLGAPHLAMNEALALADNAQFWLSPVAPRRKTGAVVFDEFHHGFTGDRSIAAFAARYGVQFAIAQLILGVCLWAGALRRFGRPRPPPEDVRVGSTDALFATSRLYREGRHHGHAATEILKQLGAEFAAVAGACPPAARPGQTRRGRAHARGRADLAAALFDAAPGRRPPFTATTCGKSRAAPRSRAPRRHLARQEALPRRRVRRKVARHDSRALPGRPAARRRAAQRRRPRG